MPACTVKNFVKIANLKLFVSDALVEITKFLVVITKKYWLNINAFEATNSFIQCTKF